MGEFVIDYGERICVCRGCFMEFWWFGLLDLGVWSEVYGEYSFVWVGLSILVAVLGSYMVFVVIECFVREFGLLC